MCVCIQLCQTLCDPMSCIAHQAPLSTAFSRQEYRSGLPFPSLEHLADSEIEPKSPALVDSTTEPPGKATMYCIIYLFVVLIICYLLLEWRASQVVLVVKNPCASAGDIRYTGSILGLGRSPLEKDDSPFQCSCLENPMDKRAWQATVHRVAKSQIQLK